MEKEIGTAIFLAGSIENKVAERWQDKVINAFEGREVIILNPRRASWDHSWEQKKENEEFYKQVDWKLDALEKSDLILMYFDLSTKSPISLLELGLFARSEKLVMCCLNGFG